jgi:hypothetical protein
MKTLRELLGRVPRRVTDFLVAFVCIFGGLSLPLPGLGEAYAELHAAVARAVVPATLESGVELSFFSLERWSVTLVVKPLAPSAPLNVPIDLRTLSFLPSACFAALAIATPLGSWRKNATLLGAGLLILQVVLLSLLVVPILSFLGGTGPVRAFELALWQHAALQVIYRALVASPGMAYAIPLFLWWALVSRARRESPPVTTPAPA